mmetsp:Transcript_29584/g.27015  ORF Transcript_29584/g.27015 Transcript_29584/m.27015 type:complete len:101 (+) Transcript_29584:196-498(+)
MKPSESKLHTSSVDPAKKAKLRQMHQAYNDVANRTEHHIKLNKSPTHNTTLPRYHYLSQSPERPIQELMPMSVTHSNSKFQNLNMTGPFNAPNAEIESRP